VAWVYTRDLGNDLGGDGGNDGGNDGGSDIGGGKGTGNGNNNNSGNTPGANSSTAPGGNGGATTPSASDLVNILDPNIPLANLDLWVNPFIDVKPDDWFYNAVAFVHANGLMVGTAEDVFSPNENLSRAMIVTILWRLEGSPAAENGTAFTDVASGQWYSDAITWASASTNGIVSGYGNNLFGPDDDITREQLALIMHNYAKYKSISQLEGEYKTEFTDADSVSSWAQDAMKWANAVGLINGRTTTTLVPSGTATRAEAAAILQRFIENIMAL